MLEVRSVASVKVLKHYAMASRMSSSAALAAGGGCCGQGKCLHTGLRPCGMRKAGAIFPDQNMGHSNVTMESEQGGSIK
ncbi:MAG: hypothetical protein RI897_2064 [Verrucomicrobiota bacterium]